MSRVLDISPGSPKLGVRVINNRDMERFKGFADVSYLANIRGDSIRPVAGAVALGSGRDTALQALFRVRTREGEPTGNSSHRRTDAVSRARHIAAIRHPKKTSRLTHAVAHKSTRRHHSGRECRNPEARDGCHDPRLHSANVAVRLAIPDATVPCGTTRCVQGYASDRLGISGQAHVNPVGRAFRKRLRMRA
jgi:hypothetical protein